MSLGFSGVAVAGRLLRRFYKEHPLRMVIVLFGYLVVGLLENVGVVIMLPMLHILLSDGAEKQSELARFVAGMFSDFGVPMALLPVIIVMVMLVFMKSVINFLVGVFNQTAILSVGYDLRMILARKVVTSQWPFLVKQPTGRYANLMGNEITLYSTAFSASFGILVDTIHVALYLGTALLVSWRFTVIACLIGVLMVVILAPTVTMVGKASRRRTLRLNSLSSLLVEVIQGIKPLKSMSRELFVIPLLKREAMELFRAQRLVVISSALRGNIPELFLVTSLGMGLYTAVELIGVNFASIMVLALLFMRIMTRVSVWQGKLHRLVNLTGSIDAVDKAVEEAGAASETFHNGIAPTLSRDVRLKSLTIAYDDECVVDGLDITFPANQISAILGPSGSGKTSILDAVLGFLEPRKGSILIDGVPLGEVSLSQWRAMIGYVPQELFLFHDTVRANITFGDDTVTDVDIDWALRVAGATEFIDSMPKGLDTIVGERGMAISGGQRQRLAIARALIRRPALLLLDEATSALDHKTEMAFCQTLRGLLPYSTIIATSHRPAIKDVADNVFQLEGGRLVDRKDGGSPIPIPSNAFSDE